MSEITTYIIHVYKLETLDVEHGNT